MNFVHVYFGDGKGKTTAAMGLALRASGHGLHVVIVQFLKGRHSGELASLALLPGVTVLRGQACPRFSKDMTPAEREASRSLHDANLQKALELLSSNSCDLLILDEALDALSLNMLSEAPLRALLSQNPLPCEIVITGHKPITWLLERADYITHMQNQKHPYALGVKARKGIEF